MTPPRQLGKVRSKIGYTFLEVIVAVAIMCMLLSMVIENSKIQVNKAKLEATINEMMSIAQASLDFYNSQGNWPGITSDLAPIYMYTAITVSPFRGSYQINNSNHTVTVSTTIPSGLAQNYYQGALLQIVPGFPDDTISITQELPHGFTGRLEYEKKYLYQ